MADKKIYEILLSNSYVTPNRATFFETIPRQVEEFERYRKTLSEIDRERWKFPLDGIRVNAYNLNSNDCFMNQTMDWTRLLSLEIATKDDKEKLALWKHRNPNPAEVLRQICELPDPKR